MLVESEAEPLIPNLFRQAVERGRFDSTCRYDRFLRNLIPTLTFSVTTTPLRQDTGVMPQFLTRPRDLAAGF
jgi:hypothetical protein